ncbi:hypothetical protein BC830DRAFT_50327 [Chytriomyces sp. MP71]|nr:hypothetical protein BC830DRAFT_50327 [Chytriomyces sp. MP71]
MHGSHDGSPNNLVLLAKTNLLTSLRLLLPSGFFSRTHETTIELDDEHDSDSDNDDAPRRASSPYKRAVTPAARTQVVCSKRTPSLSMQTLDAQTRASLSLLASKEFLQGLVSQCAHMDLALNGANGARSVAALIARAKGSRLWPMVGADEKGRMAQFLGDPNLISLWTDQVLVSEAFCHQLQIMTDKEYHDMWIPFRFRISWCSQAY